MRKNLVIGLVVILLVAIWVNVFYSKTLVDIRLRDRPEVMNLNELFSFCNYQNIFSCDDSSCENMKFNVSAYISQFQVEGDLILFEEESYPTNYYNDSEYEIGLLFQDFYPDSEQEMEFILDDSLVLTQGKPDQEKINKVILFFDNLLENSYYRDRKVRFQTEIEKRDCYTLDGQCLSCDRLLIKDLDSFELLPEGDIIFSKKDLFDEVEQCNQAFIELGEDDTCFGYHYYDRFCYYTLFKLRQCPGYGGDIKPLFEIYDLDYDDSKNFCMKFDHKGLVANCLKHIGEGNKDCLNFAQNDEYLMAICNLKKGENINFSARGINDF